MEKLNNCPFCGSLAEVQVEEADFQIVGCSNKKNPASSLLCPNPAIVVFKRGGEWDYQWWNRRAPAPHYHKNNGEDDACAECGLDLRNPVHMVLR